jgi:anti-sigma regulatory factor (Ser/Thr protein kinase)
MTAAPITAVGTQWIRGAAAETAQTRSFARRPEEVPSARRFIRECLADHPGSMDAELLTCELVTNAVQHAEDAAAVTVTVIRNGQFVYVDVVDDGRAGLPHWREASGHDESGRGFQLVNEIAYRWGFLREPAGTCVWFELAPLDPGPPRPALLVVGTLSADGSQSRMRVLHDHQR